MKKDVFISGVGRLFGKCGVWNDEMEELLGVICGKDWKVEGIVLKENGIKGG